MRILLLGLAAAALTSFAAPRVLAWGAAHVGYTHVGPNGAYHYGSTEAAGPNGMYGGAHAGVYGAGGQSYHAGYGAAAGPGGAAAGGYRAYSPSPYTPSYGGGFGTEGMHVGGEPAGVYRRY